MDINKTYKGNCTKKLKEIEDNTVDLIYFDPPFFTQKKHTLSTRKDNKKYEFSDTWDSLEDYIQLIESCLTECKRVLKPTGSVFLHCDERASRRKEYKLKIVIQTKPEVSRSRIFDFASDVKIIKSTSLRLVELKKGILPLESRGSKTASV